MEKPDAFQIVVVVLEGKVPQKVSPDEPITGSCYSSYFSSWSACWSPELNSMEDTKHRSEF